MALDPRPQPAPSPGDPAPGATWRARLRLPLAITLIALITYLAVSGERLACLPDGLHSHYTYLAEGFLQGRLALDGPPPHDNDWARVTTLTLVDGRTVRGAFLRTEKRHTFRTTRGETLHIPRHLIATQTHTTYVSFPWFPALLMLPFVALWGVTFNDVIFTAFIAALNPLLLFFLLRRLSALNLSRRDQPTNLWLVALFAFGTVHFFAAVRGQVWFTAHIVGVALTALYALAALEGRRPFWAGLCLGLSFVTRPSLILAAPLLPAELWRCSASPRAAGGVGTAHGQRRVRSVLKPLAWAGLPLLIIVGVAFLLNLLRFDAPLEFGHSYLDVRWTERIQQWGLFHPHFFWRNLSVMLFLLPRIFGTPPYLRISYHGMSLFVTTPLFLAAVWPRRFVGVQLSFYLAVLGPLLANLLYQNTGWQQFGYRFSLDYTVYLVALIALSNWPLKRPAKALILASMAINAFGAITFQRFTSFYG